MGCCDRDDRGDRVEAKYEPEADEEDGAVATKKGGDVLCQCFNPL